MATNFPNSPSNGATHTFGGTTYTYNSTKGVWKASAEAIAVGDNPPSNPETGDLWFDSSVAKTYIYYNDGSSSQWVQLNPSGGSDGTDGTDGADATGGGESPVILTEPPTTTQALNSDGSTSTVTMTAQDPEGFDITYGIAYKTTNNARPAQLSADPTINQTTGVYTFTPTTTQSNAGSFRARLSASDGVNTTTRLVDFDLTFSEDITFSSSEPGITTNLTNSIVWSASSNTSSSGMAQSANLRLGKRYFEIDITGGGTYYLIGLADEGNTNPGYNDNDVLSVYTNGNWYPGNVSGAITGGYGNGDTFMIAYDTTANEMWVGKNGTWNVDPSATGRTLNRSGALTLVIGSGSSGGSSITANILLSDNLTYSIPSGFSSH
jgi:hypothetical protein